MNGHFTDEAFPVDSLPPPMARPASGERIHGLPAVTVARLGAPLLFAAVANTFMSRLRGLHALPRLGTNDALVIRPCRSIQTWRMKYSIDLVFLDGEGVILKLETLAPGRLSHCARARIAIEMAEGTAERLSLGVGQVLVPVEGAWTC